MKNITIKLVLLLSLVLAGCASALYIPTSSDPVLQKQLTEGRDLYIHHCSSCHSLFMPNKFTKDEWKDRLDMMQDNAKINDKEKELIFKYVTSAPKQK